VADNAEGEARHLRHKFDGVARLHILEPSVDHFRRYFRHHFSKTVQGVAPKMGVHHAALTTPFLPFGDENAATDEA